MSKILIEEKKKIIKLIQSRIRTTMIGAISSIEEFFGFLWNASDLSDEDKQKMLQIFLQTRSNILDKGNVQIRNIENDLDKFNICKYSNTTYIPITPVNNKELR